MSGDTPRHNQHKTDYALFECRRKVMSELANNETELIGQKSTIAGVLLPQESPEIITPRLF